MVRGQEDDLGRVPVWRNRESAVMIDARAEKFGSNDTGGLVQLTLLKAISGNRTFLESATCLATRNPYRQASWTVFAIEQGGHCGLPVAFRSTQRNPSAPPAPLPLLARCAQQLEDT